jgi:hypothetical protein
VPIVSFLLSLALVLTAFLGLVLAGALAFEPVTPAHVGLAAVVAPLAVALHRLLRRLGW